MVPHKTTQNYMRLRIYYIKCTAIQADLLGRQNPPTKLEPFPNSRDVAANIHPLESPAADKVPGGREKNLFSFRFPPPSFPYLICSSQSSAGIHKGKSGSWRPSQGAPDPGGELSMGASHGKKKAYNIEQQSVKSGKHVNGKGKSALVFLPEQ
ncbi:hypothetical protein PGIGA_G00117900 [Pangasianodon gigas]|uniref:Uncharacterized protein n=1 Tax=Pangasianodon gigas TaxID=30993 RepID=A0ACC5XFT7_PANGG|nr:hypothetical protein [Pangasianodon gigas]